MPNNNLPASEVIAEASITSRYLRELARNVKHEQLNMDREYVMEVADQIDQLAALCRDERPILGQLT